MNEMPKELDQWAEAMFPFIRIGVQNGDEFTEDDSRNHANSCLKDLERMVLAALRAREREIVEKASLICDEAAKLAERDRCFCEAATLSSCGIKIRALLPKEP